MRAVLLPGLLLVASCDGVAAHEEILPSSEAIPAATEVAQLEPSTGEAPRQSSTSRSFSRPNWVDADHDCQSTRTEVLVLEAAGPVEFEDDGHCKVARGTWHCPYTGEVFHDPRELDIDHLVPLKNAWQSGASTWTDERWRQYANDLEHGEHLVAVAASANRAKGDRGPDKWLPPLAEARCTYVVNWVATKARWGLRATDAEAEATERALALCDASEIPPLPQAAKEEVRAPTAKPQTSESAKQCCKTCRKGKACGDTCIARDRSCSAEPGCACDG